MFGRFPLIRLGGSGKPTGYLPDLPDTRDRLIGALGLASPPPRASVAHPLVQPDDQIGNSCTGFALKKALRLSYLAKGDDCGELSGLDIYWNGRAVWGGQHVDDGSYLRTAIKAVQKIGAASEETWPTIRQNLQRPPMTFAARRSAHDFRGIRGYYRIAPTGDDVMLDAIRSAIAAGHAIAGGWPVDRAFVEELGAWIIDRPTGALMGLGHAFVLEDYESDGTFGCLNSWGRAWRNGGRARLTEAFVASARDVWAVVV